MTLLATFGYPNNAKASIGAPKVARLVMGPADSEMNPRIGRSLTLFPTQAFSLLSRFHREFRKILNMENVVKTARTFALFPSVGSKISLRGDGMITGSPYWFTLTPQAFLPLIVKGVPAKYRTVNFEHSFEYLKVKLYPLLFTSFAIRFIVSSNSFIVTTSHTCPSGNSNPFGKL